MAIGDPINDRAAKARNDTYDHADDGTPNREPDIGKPVFDAVKPATAERLFFRDSAVLAQQRNNLWDRKNAKADDHQLQTIGEIRKVVRRHAQIARRCTFTNSADQHPQTGCNNPFDRHTTGEDANHRQTKNGDHQKFRCSKLQHDWPCNQDKDCQERRADQTTKKRRRKRGGQRPRRLPAFGHRKPVKYCCLARGGSGDTHQN